MRSYAPRVSHSFSLQSGDCSAPWDWTPGEVKARKYDRTKKGGYNDTATKIYRPTGCATRCIMGRSPEARDRARGDQRSCGFRREDFFLAKYHTVWYTLRESRTQAQRR